MQAGNARLVSGARRLLADDAVDFLLRVLHQFSMRAGWIRLSRTSFSIVRRATSRRTGSKLEMVTASGVSSTTTSTPVACSKARMLRPLRR